MLQVKTPPPFKSLPTAQQKPILTAAISEAIENRARAGLIDFAQFIDPTQRRWYRAAHLRRIAGLLERVERGELRRLIISVPPRHWKSSLASEKFPAWYLGRNPHNAIILASYGLQLAEKFSRSVRDTITGNSRFASLFSVSLKRDSNRADDWSLLSAVRSSLRAVGVGGGITGHGANLVLIDDPIADYEAAQSETQRNNLWEWYRQVLRTRLEPNGAIVLIQTRWHEDDLAGRLIRAEQEEGGEHWEVVNIPAQDPDTKEYLWLDRYSAEEYAAIEASVGAYAWQALYQGDPTQAEGNEIKAAWFEYVPHLPIGAKWRWRAWDVAWTLKQTQKHDPDFTGTGKGTLHNDILYLGEPRLFRTSLDGLATEIVSAKIQEPSIIYGMGKSAVKSTLVTAMNNAGFSIQGYDESSEPLVEAGAFINLASQGRVKLVGTAKEWEATMAQWTAFPNGAHDDAVAWAAGMTKMANLHFNTLGFVEAKQVTQREQIQTLRGPADPNAGRYMGEFAPKG